MRQQLLNQELTLGRTNVGWTMDQVGLTAGWVTMGLIRSPVCLVGSTAGWVVGVLVGLGPKMWTHKQLCISVLVVSNEIFINLKCSLLCFDGFFYFANVNTDDLIIVVLRKETFVFVYLQMMV